MSREELFIDILGGLDEKYVALAMPRSCGHDVPDDTRKTIPIKPIEVTNEVSRKESVMYWVMRSLGIAAAAFLIIGAAVLLIMNWDKIAVREPDRPGIVTTQSTTSTTIDTESVKGSESSVTLPPPLDYDSMTDEEKFAAKLLNGLRWKMNEQEVRLVAKETWDRTEVRVQREDSNVLQEYYNVMIYDNVELYGEKANLNLVVFDNAGLKSLEYQVRYEVSDEGAENADKLYERIRADFVNALGEPNYPDLNWWDFADSKLHFDVYKADNWIVEIKIDDTSDPYEEITDTSMPEPYDDDPVRHIDFAAQWVSSFYTFEPMIPQEKRDMYYEWVQNPFGYTPYTITDNCNIISSVRKLELDWNDTKEILISSQVLSDDDISVIDNALTNSDESAFKHLIEKFRSPYAVIGDFNGNGYNVFSPLWLYYHTIGDYKAMRVPAKAVEDIIPIYASNLGLRDEAWAAFREKLYKYISGEKDNTAVTTSAVTESNGTTAVAVTSETTTSDVIGDTTVISDTDSSADTTVPAEDRPTDDELKALVEQGAEACGLNVSISDLTRGSLKLHYTRDKSVKYADKLTYEMGNRYEIQVRNSAGEWETYDPETLESWNDGTHWFDSLLGLGGEYENEEEKETVLFYGKDMYETEIPSGYYRVKKGVSVYSKETGEHLGRLDAYAEFTIDEHTPNVFGITMTAKNVSPESVTLAVQQSGASFHVKRNLGYKARFVLESKTESGEWKKVDGNPVTWAPDIEPINENGVTEINEDFSDIYGSLPDGTYRISKQFVNYVGTGETKDDILNSSTYYCEFVIGEKTHDWGITMSAKDVTPAGMTLLIDQKGGNSTGELTYGEDFSIEVKSDEFGTWEKLGYITDEINWTDIGYILEPGAHNENQINWTYIYGYLPAGHYRLVKEFMDFRKTGDYDQCDFYMEFDVPEIDSKLGITLNTKRNTARWITLDAASIGDTVSEHMSFNENRYVIEQKKNGKWTEYYTTAVPGIPTPETARKINAGDVVTFTVDWRERAGSLPVGEYRIGLTFTGGSVSETIYAEFTVEEYMTNEFGLQIRPIEVSRTGGRFAFESLGGDYNVRTLSDKEFSLQKQTAEGEWKTLSAAEGAVSQKSSSPTLTAFTGGGSSGIMGTIEWKELFGTLSAGHYRLGKKFSAVIDGKTKEIMICCEFDITADTPEKIAE